MTATYSSREVAQMAGVSYRQLDYWVRLGLLEPAAVSASGSGSVRQWLPRQVATVAVLGEVAALSALSRPLAMLTRLVEFLDDLPLRSWSTTRIMLDARGEVWRIDRAGTPRVGTYIDLAIAAPVIMLIASHKAA